MAVAPDKPSGGLAPYVYTPCCGDQGPFLEPDVPESVPTDLTTWVYWDIGMAEPTEFHWALAEDKAFDAHLTQVKQEQANREASASAEFKGKGTKHRNPASKGGSITRAKKPKLGAKNKISALQSLINEAQLGEGEEGGPDFVADLTGGLLDVPLPDRVKSDVDDLLGSIHSFQLQALYEIGSVRMVDRALTEGFSAKFLRLSRVVTEDLTKSLHHHHEQVQEGVSDLEAFMYRLVSQPLLVKHTKKVTKAMQKFKWMAAMNLLLPLLHLDLARGDIAQFLSLHLEETCAREESKILIEALTERLTNLQSQTW